MDVLSSSETVEARFALYGNELREFFASHQLACGSPQDVVVLAERLGSPGLFPEEMSSMLRSILYREKGTVPRAQFLELVVKTVGGAHGGTPIDSSAQEFHEPIRRIFEFIGGVLRPPRPPVAAEDRPHAAGLQAQGVEIQDVERKGVQGEGLRTEVLQAEGRSGFGPAVISHVPSPASTEPVSPFQAPETFGLAEPAGLPGEPESEAAKAEAAKLGATKVPEPTSPVGSLPSPLSSVQSFATPLAPSRTPGLRDFSGGSSNGTASGTSNFGNSKLGTPNLWMLGLGVLLFGLVAFFFHRHAADSANFSDGFRQAAAGSVPPNAPRSVRPGSGAASSDPAKSGLSKPSASVSPHPRNPDGLRSERANREGPGSALAGQPGRAGESFDNSQSSASGSSSAANASTQAASKQEASGADASTSSEPATSNRPASSDPAPIYPPSSNGAKPRILRAPRGTRYKGQGTFSVSSGVMASNLLSASPPEYPKLARLAHTQGQVILQVVVSRSGTVIDTRVLSGHLILRGAAVKAVRRWRYRPYLVQGRPTDVATIVTVNFSLPR